MQILLNDNKKIVLAWKRRGKEDAQSLAKGGFNTCIMQFG
jgi:hypothetical protein